MLKVPRIGMGTGFSDEELKDPEKIVNAIRVGIDCGIRFIDTAENYGGGVCEELVGRAVAEKRPHIMLASKFAPEHSSYDDVIASCEGSLRRMKTDYIDLYQTHWPNPSVPFEETLRALHLLQKQGKIRAIGMSNVSVNELGDAISLQAEYNLFERTVEYDGTLEYCQKNNITLIAYSPLDQGRTDQKVPSPLQLAWLISHDSVVAIPKSINHKHIKENAEAMQIVLEPEEKARMDREFFQKIAYIPTDDISVSSQGERDRAVYQTLDEAIENKFGYTHSPMELSKTFLSGGFAKPVRLVLAKNSQQYALINGRIRYWAWVIAFQGKKPIPAYIRNDLKVGE